MNRVITLPALTSRSPPLRPPPRRTHAAAVKVAAGADADDEQRAPNPWAETMLGPAFDFWQSIIAPVDEVHAPVSVEAYAKAGPLAYVAATVDNYFHITRNSVVEEFVRREELRCRGVLPRQTRDIA